MTSPLGSADFFALEAGECLGRLEQLIGQDDAPAGDVLRAARLLRGSALLANQQAIARAAAALEAVLRGYRDGERAWDAALREQLAQAVEDLRLLIRRTREWSEGDTARATRLAVELEQLAGVPPGERPAQAPAPQPTPAQGVPVGVRAFIAREGALIAGALDRAARSVAGGPETREPLYTVLRRMQSLRGLAELAELPPLPELLDGLELAVGDLSHLHAPPPGAVDVLDAGARALTRISRDVAERGTPEPDAEETRRFTELLLRTFALERDVVPIAALFPDDEPDPMRPAPSGPVFAPPAELTPLELVSHGEHFAQAAEGVERAGSAAERDLRLYALVAPLRALALSAVGGLGDGLHRFADLARERIGTGEAGAAPAEFAELLREAGHALRAAADDSAASARALARLVERMAGGTGAPAPAEAPPSVRAPEPAGPPAEAVALADVPPPAPLAGPVPPAAAAGPGPEPEPEPVVPIQALAYPGEPMIVAWGAPPAESLAEPAEEAVVPIEALAPDAAMDQMLEPEHAGALETSYLTYEALLRTRAPEPPSLAALMGAGPAEEPAAAAPAATEPVGTADADGAAEPHAVGILALCYRGPAALARAGEVRAELLAGLAQGRGLPELRPLLDELLDLVPLAAADG